jgi:hypothetical protein
MESKQLMVEDCETNRGSRGILKTFIRRARDEASSLG